MPLQDQLKDQLKNSYVNWLNQRITVKDLNGVFQITSPLTDRNRDRLQIYVIPDGDKLILSDDGYIVNELLMSGCDIFSSNKRTELLKVILNSYAVKLDGEVLYTNATIENFPQKKHAILQAMLAVNDMFLITQDNVTSIFLEEVENYLIENEIRYTDNVTFTGKSGFNHNFDFVIPKFKDNPERIIKSINSLTREKSESLLFAWDDTRDTRKSNSILYAFINDSEKKVSRNIISAFSEYQVKPVLWSEKNQFIKELSA